MEHLGVDVMIVGRGGGSIEDLWAFNEEAVAQAVFDCRTPVISAVGHETDTTIIDFVADLRAPTPSAAAELAVYDFSQLMEKLERYQSALNHAISQKIQKQKIRLQTLQLQTKYLSPANQIQQKRMYALDLETKLSGLMGDILDQQKHRMALYAEKLKGLSPLEKLSQGYAYVEDENHRVLNDIHRTNLGDNVQIFVKNGVIGAEVKEIREALVQLKNINCF